MIHFIDKVLENLRPYVPLFQTSIWPAFIGILIWHFRRQLGACIEAIRNRIETGSSLKAGPIEIGEDLRKLEYASPQGVTSSPEQSTADTWEKERTGIYKNNSGLFLTHVLTPSHHPDQKYDIFIYLIRHNKADFSDIEKAEFFFGHMWGNKVFTERSKDGKIGVSTSAYGPFLCTCRVHLNNGDTIHLHRYIDFEMERIMDAEQVRRGYRR